jgi:predicted PurR-regulated permease PerM
MQKEGRHSAVTGSKFDLAINLEVLGMNGIVLGPVIAAMFMVVWDILATSNRRKPTSVDKAR